MVQLNYAPKCLSIGSINISEGEVYHSLLSLDPTKTIGIDSISMVVLNFVFCYD